MARSSIKSQMDAIREVLAASQTPLSIAAIEAALAGRSKDRRTLQRRLQDLIASQSVVASGAARARVYSLISPAPAPHEPASEGALSLSSASQRLLLQISRPEIQRTPVGYNRAFLDAYTPNHTFYLPETKRVELLAIGASEVAADAPAGTFARQLFARLLIDLAWNSSRLEGNTYSLLDTERLLSEGKSADGKTAQETQMILNHKVAIEFLVESASEIGFQPMTIQNLHAALSDNLLPDPSAPGRLRRGAVGIGNSVFHPLETPQLIEETFRAVLLKAEAIADPYEQAFFAMVHLPYLQPFDDVNKRVSRLAANIPMVRRNLAPISFRDVPRDLYLRATLAVYELNQTALLADVFAFACIRSAQTYRAVRQSLGAPDAFRLRWREAIRDLVRDIIVGAMTPDKAHAAIADWARAHMDGREQAQFTDVVETELRSLHDGNFARYRVRPSQFHAWRALWR